MCAPCCSFPLLYYTLRLSQQVCADTIVGNQMLRGVSGGQRKRVTTGELMVGPAKTLFMDEISTGLDSSTTYLIVRCIKNYVELLDATVMMSLLQPPPEVFSLFTDVMLLRCVQGVRAARSGVGQGAFVLS